METRRLRHFVTTVDSGTMTRAAQQLRIAQPALSQSIAILERDFGQSLLVRSHNGVVPTESGWELYRYAREMLRLEETARRRVQDGYESPSETVAVGVAPYSAVPAFIVPLIAEVKRRYPRIVVRLVEALSVAHSEAVRRGMLDVALLYHPGPVSGVTLTSVSTDRVCLVRARGHGPHVEPDAPVPLEEIAGTGLILPRPTHTLRALVERAYAHQGASPNVVLEIEHSAPLPEAVLAGIGATLLPEHVARTIFDGERFEIRPVVEPAVSVRFALATATDVALSRGAELVVELLRAHMLAVHDKPGTVRITRGG